jgi:hypothetical protein
MPTPPRRRWYQFSLGALLFWITVYVACLAFIWGPAWADPPSDPDNHSAEGVKALAYFFPRYIDAFGRVMFWFDVILTTGLTIIWAIVAILVNAIIAAIWNWRDRRHAVNSSSTPQS